MPVRLLAIVTLWTLGGQLCGCHASLPTYPAMPADDAIAILRERTGSIHTIEAASRIVMRNVDGDDAVLDGALVARNPGWLRMRAWKFNTAVFDITLTPEGLWMLAGRRGEESFEEGVSASDIASGWAIINGDFLGESPVVVQGGEDELVLQSPSENHGQTTRCHIDVATLTPRRYEVEDDAGRPMYEVALSKYRMHGELLWAHKITLESEHGRIVIETRDVVLNEEPAPAAFQPPRNAVKQP